MEVFIPFLTGKTFLINAINSLGKYKKDVVVIDNSLDLDPYEEVFKDVTIMRPPITLRFTDTMNLIQNIAKGNNPDEPFLFMHSDAEVTEAAVERIYTKVKELDKHKWGVIFSLYDILCAFNPYAIQEVGPWDNRYFQYSSDCEYYNRLKKFGFEPAEAGGKDIIHHSSMTLNTSSIHKYNTIIEIPYRHLLEEETKNKIPGEVKMLIGNIQNSEVFRKMSTAFEDGRGNLLDISDEQTMQAQVAYLTHLIRTIRPNKVLEVGTNKGMFGLLLAHLRSESSLDTFDINHESSTSLKHLQPFYNVRFFFGDSKEILSLYNDTADFAWIDGGHATDVVLSDLRNMNRLKVPFIALDDCKLDEVKESIDTFVQESGYSIRVNPWWDDDPRGILLLRRT